MLEVLIVVGRTLTLALRDDRELVLENIAPPQQRWQRRMRGGQKQSNPESQIQNKYSATHFSDRARRWTWKTADTSWSD